MRGFHHAKILSPSFHGLRKEHLAQWPAFCIPKIPGGTSRKIGRGCAARFLKPLPYFRPKSVIFPTLFQTWSPGARRVTGARDKLLRHVHGSWRKHWKGMVLLPNDEDVANSPKKRALFKTRVHKPYPISDKKRFRPKQLKKKIPFGAAHTYIPYIRDYPPPPPPQPGWKTRCRLWVSLA